MDDGLQDYSFDCKERRWYYVKVLIFARLLKTWKLQESANSSDGHAGGSETLIFKF